MAKIQFVYFDGCPKAADLWENLLVATAKIEKLNLDIEKIDSSQEEVSPEYKLWGSPTILLDGADISGYTKQTGGHCRHYDGEKGGVLSVETIENLIINKLK